MVKGWLNGVRMPYCPKCGKEVTPEAVFCPSCRTTLRPTERGRERYIKRRNLIGFIMIALIALAPVFLYMTRPILRVENTTSTGGWNLTWGFYVTVRGEIFNDGFRPAHNVRVNIIGYDSSGKVVESDYDVIGEIPAKGSRAFSVLLDIEMGESIFSYKVNLEYDIWSIA